MRPPKAKVEKTRTVHTYSELWHASSCLLETGRKEPRGASWQYLSSIILTAFTFEAYLNHAGKALIACWDDIERLPPLGKFKLLCEFLKVEFPKGGAARPMQTINDVIEFRNTMAHGRTGQLEMKPQTRDINNRLDQQLGDRPQRDWELRIKTSDFADRAREDVESVLKLLHEARPEPKEPLFAFGMSSASATPEA